MRNSSENEREIVKSTAFRLRESVFIFDRKDATQRKKYQRSLIFI